MHRRELLKRGVGPGRRRWRWRRLERVWRGPRTAGSRPGSRPTCGRTTGPTAISFGKVRPFTYLRLHGEVQNGRIYVFNPKTQNFAYVDAGLVGPSAPPPAGLSERSDLLRATLNMPARVDGTASIYREPSTDEIGWAHDLGSQRHPVLVKDLVEAEDQHRWYRLQDGTFVLEEQVRVRRTDQAAGRQVDRRDR